MEKFAICKPQFANKIANLKQQALSFWIWCLKICLQIANWDLQIYYAVSAIITPKKAKTIESTQ